MVYYFIYSFIIHIDFSFFYLVCVFILFSIWVLLSFCLWSAAVLRTALYYYYGFFFVDIIDCSLQIKTKNKQKIKTKIQPKEEIITLFCYKK